MIINLSYIHLFCIQFICTSSETVFINTTIKHSLKKIKLKQNQMNLKVVNTQWRHYLKHILLVWMNPELTQNTHIGEFGEKNLKVN